MSLSDSDTHSVTLPDNQISMSLAKCPVANGHSAGQCLWGVCCLVSSCLVSCKQKTGWRSSTWGRKTTCCGAYRRGQALLTVKSLQNSVCPEYGDADGAQGEAALAEAAAKRKADDRNAKAFLILSVGPQHLGTVSRAASAADAWAMLKSVYAAWSTARQMQLKQELNLVVKGPGESLMEYLTHATDTRDQLLVAGYDIRDVRVVLSC